MTPRPVVLSLLGLLVAGSAAGLHVAIVSPEHGTPRFGPVEFEAEVIPEDRIQEVVMVLDNGIIARFERPPFKTEFDLGEENRPHLFEVAATDTDGTTFRAALEMPAIPVDMEIDVELRQLYLTVTRNGARVENLERSDFEVFDNRTSQQIVTFARGDIPFVAVLLVDASRSMQGARLTTATAGAQVFAASMQPLDQAKLTLFNDRISHSTPFTSYARVLGIGLSDVRASGGTSLNDNLYLALRQLEKRQGRRLVILLSDGVDISSVLDIAGVTVAARQCRSMIFWIRPREPAGRVSHLSAWRDSESHRREIRGLERLVEETGGRIVSIASIGEAAEAFAEILAEIRAQYVIGYYPSDDDGSGTWHRVDVRTTAVGLEVRTRQGYLED